MDERDEEEKEAGEEEYENEDQREFNKIREQSYINNQYAAQQWFSDLDSKFDDEFLTKDITLSNITPLDQKKALINTDLFFCYKDLSTLYPELNQCANLCHFRNKALCAFARAVNGKERNATISQISELKKYFEKKEGEQEKKKGFSFPFFNFGKKKRQGGY